MNASLTTKAFFRSSVLMVTVQWIILFVLWGSVVSYSYKNLDYHLFLISFITTGIILLFLIYYFFFSWYFKRWTAYEDDFIWISPWPYQGTKKYPLEELISGEIKRSLLQKVFGMGSIHLAFENKEKTKRTLKMPWIHNPDQVLDHIQKSQINKFKDFLKKFSHGVLTYSNGDKKPHSAFVQVQSNNEHEIFFKTCKDFRKYQSLSLSPNVSLSFGKRESGVLHIKGIAQEIKEYDLNNTQKKNIGTRLRKQTQVSWNGYAYFQIIPTEFRLNQIDHTHINSTHLILN